MNKYIYITFILNVSFFTIYTRSFFDVKQALSGRVISRTHANDEPLIVKKQASPEGRKKFLEFAMCAAGLALGYVLWGSSLDISKLRTKK